MDKRNIPVLARFRGWIQAAAALLTNIHLPNFLQGKLYQGGGKAVCVPGLNCYSCPGAAGACPIGAFQAVVGSSKFRFSYYITGILILLGVLLGRFICGFLCPFGWFQELADDDGVGAVFHLKVQQLPQGGEIHGLFGKGRDNGHTGPGEERLFQCTHAPFQLEMGN